MIVGGEFCRLLLGGKFSARRRHEPVGVGCGRINRLQLFADLDHGRPLSGSVQPVSLCAQTGKLVLVAGVCQPGIRVSIVRVGVGDHGVFRDRLLPIPGIGSRGRLCVVHGQLLLAARQLQLSGSVGVVRLATEDLAQQVDGLIPLLGPKCGQRLVVELFHLRSRNLLVRAIGSWRSRSAMPTPWWCRKPSALPASSHRGYQPLGVEGDGVDLDRVPADQRGQGGRQLVRARHPRLVHQDRDHPNLPG